MKEWYSASELLALNLPGLPGSKPTLLALSEEREWQARPRRGRGGGMEFHVSSLPPAAQAKLLLRIAPPPPPPPVVVARQDAARIDRLLDHLLRRPDSIKDEAKRRLNAVVAIERLVEAGTGKVQAVETVAREIGDSPATVRRWLAKIKDRPRGEWYPLLAPAWCGRTTTADVSPEAWAFFRDDYLRLERPAAEACYERLQRVAPEMGWTVPSLKTLVRKLEREIPPTVVVLRRHGEKAAARMFPAQQRNHAVFKAMEAVNADGHTFDVRVEWLNGTVGRPVLVAVQDIYSGKIVGWRIGESESRELIRLAFLDAFVEFGPADVVWFDNGRAFASKTITGGTAHRHRFKIKDEEPIGILTQAGSAVRFTTPYHGQAKPIERAFRDLCEYVAKHPLCAGAYTGNNPVNKPENYGSKAVPIGDFVELVAEEIRRHNAREGRRSPVCAGRSFDRAFAESYQSAMPRRLTERQRQLFLLAAEGVTASRTDGTVKLLGNRYWCEALSRHLGRRLVARFDPQRLAEPLHLYTLDGGYIGAAELVEMAGYADAETAREHNRARREFLKKAKEMADAERRLEALEIAALLPRLPTPPAPPPAQVVRPVFGNLAVAAAARPADEVEPAPAVDRDQQFSNAIRLLRLERGDTP